MQIVGLKLSRKEFTEYVNKKFFGYSPANKLVIHHTWKPRKEDWQGERTIQGLKRYYEGLGWGVGPHIFVAEDGIWLFSDMRKDGIHAGEGNYRSIGIEVVGDYDKEKWSGKTKVYALHVIKTLQERLGAEIKFHRDYSSKTCPGSAITKEWIIEELKNKPVQEEKSETVREPEKEQKTPPEPISCEPERAEVTYYKKKYEETLNMLNFCTDELERVKKIKMPSLSDYEFGELIEEIFNRIKSIKWKK